MSWWMFSLDLLSTLCAWPNVGGSWGCEVQGPFLSLETGEAVVNPGKSSPD